MPYLIMTSRYPSDKVSATAERYLEVLAKYPHDESLSEEIVPVAVKSTHKGIKSFSNRFVDTLNKPFNTDG